MLLDAGNGYVIWRNRAAIVAASIPRMRRIEFAGFCDSPFDTLVA
jgi:hypothetical protein